MTEPIEIVIRKTGESAYQPQTPSVTAQGKSKGSSIMDKAVNVALINAGQQLFSTAINQYGDLTGNTLANKSLDNLSKIASSAQSIVTGGWVGVIAVGVSLINDEIGRTAQRNTANRNAEMMRQRGGNILINGGRGTND